MVRMPNGDAVDVAMLWNIIWKCADVTEATFYEINDACDRLLHEKNHPERIGDPVFERAFPQTQMFVSLKAASAAEPLITTETIREGLESSLVERKLAAKALFGLIFSDVRYSQLGTKVESFRDDEEEEIKNRLFQYFVEHMREIAR